MSGWFTDAMLCEMAQISGQDWSNELSDVWRTLLSYLADLMIAGQERVSGDPLAALRTRST